MAEDVRATQHVIEILSPIIVPARVSQTVIEILSPIVVPMRQTQEVVEILSPIQVTARITQNIIEVIMPGMPDMSGIYFINTKKAEWHDSYYGDRSNPPEQGPGQELKIPDPTIRLPYLGD